MTEMKPIDYAKHACDTMMRRYKATELPPKGHFHYHQGVFLSGVYQTFLLSGEEKYYSYIKEWVDSIIDDNGELHWFDPGQLDDIQPGILLFPLFEKTKDERYKTALEHLMSALYHFPRNSEGGFWHKTEFSNQMWLDGLYMAGPISAEYASCFGEEKYMELAVEQALLMAEKTRDRETGLWYHAWDSLKEAEWADPVTGQSAEFWGRSIGWVPVALLDEMEFMDVTHPSYQLLGDLVRELLQSLCKYQSDDGRWYQVIDKGDQPGNWLENSCSCLIVAAICKAVRLGVLPLSYLDIVGKGYHALIQSLTWEGLDLQIGGVCIGTGVGDYEHYCDRPVSVNDLHGVGAFLLMCAQVQQIF